MYVYGCNKAAKSALRSALDQLKSTPRQSNKRPKSTPQREINVSTFRNFEILFKSSETGETYKFLQKNNKAKIYMLNE